MELAGEPPPTRRAERYSEKPGRDETLEPMRRLSPAAPPTFPTPTYPLLP